MDMVTYLPYLCVASTIYIVSVPIARMAMLECYPTRYAISASIVSIIISFCLNYVSQLLWAVFTLTIVNIGIAIATYIIEIRGPVPNPVDMRGYVILVTGANSGIGAETVRQLAAMGATVVMGCRSLVRAQPVCDQINTSLKSSPMGGRAVILDKVSLDLCSLASVRQYTKALLSQYPAIDVLVCNAGLIPGGFSSHIEKVHGKDVQVEDCFSSNHLGHHLLIHLLLPALKLAKDNRDHRSNTDTSMVSSLPRWPHGAPSRIVIVSSSIHKVATSQQGSTMTLDPSKYVNMVVYGASKLAGMYAARVLSKRIATDPRMEQYKGSVHINTLHPGNPSSNVSSNLPFILQLLESAFQPLLMLYRETCAQGAYCSVWTATSNDAITAENQYYVHMAPSPQNPAVYDEESAKRLYNLSQQLCELEQVE